MYVELHRVVAGHDNLLYLGMGIGMCCASFPINK